MTQQRRLRLIRGGRQHGVRLGRVQVEIWTEQRAPCAAAVVYEEDTFLTLSAPTRLTEPSEHPIRTFTDALEAEPIVPGTVLVGASRPLELLAVVHDLDRDPSWSGDWVAAALAGVMDQAARRQVRELALPLLGTVHGRLPLEEAVSLTAAAIGAVAQPFPARVWLVVPEPLIAEVNGLLARPPPGENGR